MVSETRAAVSPTAQPAAIFSGIVAGVMIGIIQVVMALSLASLVFSGPLAADLPRGLTVALISPAIHVLFCTLFRPPDGVINNLQDSPAVLISVAAAALAGGLTGSALLPTVITLIFATTVLTGVFMIGLGRFNLGRFVRYIPYPVIGGFLGGGGWLLVQGSIGAMSPYKLTIANLPVLLSAEQLVLRLPGVLFGAVLFVAVRRSQNRLVLPGVLALGLLLFYAALLISDVSVAAAAQRGLLLGVVGQPAPWQPFPLADLVQADWGAVLSQAGTIGAVLALTTVTLLLNISGLELILRRDFDLNRELQTVGFANLLSGLAGGMVGYFSVTQSTLHRRFGGQGRLAGLIAGTFALLTLGLGSSLVAYIPKLLLGGLLVFLGLGFLNDWVVRARRQLGRSDYAVVLTIVIVMAVSGFFAGLGVGLVLMIVLFALNYSRLDLFHRVASGAEVTSRFARAAYHQRMLTRLGKSIAVLELQGYIFFGTANVVLEHVRQQVLAGSQPPLQFVLLDFRRVTGLDSSAAFSFARLKHLAETHGLTLVLTNLTPLAQNDLMRSGMEADERTRFYPDLDRGLEFCEDLLLEREQVTKVHFPATLALQLADSGFSREDTLKLQAYLERRQFAAGDYLIRQNDPADALFFVEMGQVSVYLELENDKKVRLQTLGLGTIVGELGFFLNRPRSASVIADFPTTAYGLKRQALEAMLEKDPALAAVFHALMVSILSERLVVADDALAALNR